MDKNQLWEKALKFLEANTTQLSYKTWIIPLGIHHIDEDAAIIYLSWKNESNLLPHVIENYNDMIEQAFNNNTEKPYKIIIKQEKEYESSQIDTRNFKNPLNQEKLFNPRFNFENFIVGNNNSYAHAVSLAVSENPGSIYNPLYIYGGSGLGKTHLMQAIGVNIIRNKPETKVLYVTTEIFTNELITAIRENKMKSFKNKYRKLDVLLIDDIQFLEGKDSTQEEFFNTFNSLIEQDKQIVITSDCAPIELKGLADRLRSRFSQSMVVNIQPPDYETRVAILKNFVEKSNIEIDKDFYDAICLIADQVKNNIRDLEGACTRVIGLSTLMGEKINVNNARNLLKDYIKDNEQALAPERIRNIVANHYNIKVSDMDSPKRNSEILLPRQVAMYLCRKNANLSLPSIGKLFGNKDHSTVMHAIKKIETKLQTDSDLRENIKLINVKINS